MSPRCTQPRSLSMRSARTASTRRAAGRSVARASASRVAQPRCSSSPSSGSVARRGRDASSTTASSAWAASPSPPVVAVAAIGHRPDGRRTHRRIGGALAQPFAADTVGQPHQLLRLTPRRLRPGLRLQRIHGLPRLVCDLRGGTVGCKRRRGGMAGRRRLLAAAEPGEERERREHEPQPRRGAPPRRRRAHGVNKSSVRLPTLRSSSTCLLKSWTARLMCMLQNLGPHMEQNSALLK
jgi:hypothetical protein